MNAPALRPVADIVGVEVFRTARHPFLHALMGLMADTSVPHEIRQRELFDTISEMSRIAALGDV